MNDIGLWWLIGFVLGVSSGLLLALALSRWGARKVADSDRARTEHLLTTRTVIPCDTVGKRVGRVCRTGVMIG